MTLTLESGQVTPCAELDMESFQGSEITHLYSPALKEDIVVRIVLGRIIQHAVPPERQRL